MREPSPDSPLATFTPLHQGAYNCIRERVVLSSAARFPNEESISFSVSLLLKSVGENRVLVETLNPSLQHLLVPGLEFELYAGNLILGRGAILGPVSVKGENL